MVDLSLLHPWCADKASHLPIILINATMLCNLRSALSVDDTLDRPNNDIWNS